MNYTQSPWYWKKFGASWKLISPKNGLCTVMDFVRQGMQGAQPRFSDRNGKALGGRMIDARNLDLNTHPDARLIAAAPELLETCKMAYSAIESLPINAFGEGTYTETNGESCRYPVRDEILHNIALQISKAEGKQNEPV